LHLEESVEAYCPLLEKRVRLRGEPAGRNIFLPTECSEEKCPMKGSINCLLFKAMEAQA